VIETCLNRRLTPFVSPSLLLEYRDVIAREEPFTRARLNLEERALLLRAFVSRCTWQEVHFKWRPNLPDEADTHIMELAIAASAAMTITSNMRDFSRQELKFPKIEIVRPEQAIERLNR